MPEICCLGEALIDFVSTQSGVSLAEAPAFQKAPGGAPANVAVGLSRLGVESAFLGMVGEDAFGHFLARILEENGVDTRGLRFSSEARTALAFVSLDAEGERDFVFYRHPSADMLYSEADVDEELLAQGKLFHFGSISLIGEPARGATLAAIEAASQGGALISYDPNLRINLWASAEAAKEGIELGWQRAQIIKLSEEEMQFLAGAGAEAEAVERLWHAGLKLIVVTKGKAGCSYYTQGFAGDVPGFKVEAVDTTGAGDGFVAGLLSGLLGTPNALEEEATLQKICRRANAVGALTTTKRGAIPALPHSDEVSEFLGAQST